MDTMLWVKNLKLLRKESKKSQTDIAEELGVRQQVYGSWETGRYKPDLAQSYKISQIYGVALQDMIEKDIVLHAEIVERVRVKFSNNSTEPVKFTEIKLPTEEQKPTVESLNTRMLDVEKTLVEVLKHFKK